MTPEFSRTVRVDTLGSSPRTLDIAATEEECAALAARFGLAGIERLSASVSLARSGEDIAAEGAVTAAVTQICVASGEPVPAAVEETFSILFRPHPKVEAEEEVELGEDEMDVIFYDGALIDLGEAAAETLSLSLEPYPRAPDAETVLREAGVASEEEARPAGAFAALKDMLGPKA